MSDSSEILNTDEPTRFMLTFGSAEEQEDGMGRTRLGKYFIVVAPTYEVARRMVIRLFGDAWAFLYDGDELQEFLENVPENCLGTLCAGILDEDASVYWDGDLYA